MGTVVIAPANAPATTTTLRAPRPVDFTGTTSALDLDLTLAPAAQAPRWQQIEARDLQVYRVENEQDADRPLTRPVSTVLSGSLFFESVGGTERKLRPGEMLRFGGASGTFLTLDLRDDGIATTFQGDVRDLRICEHRIRYENSERIVLRDDHRPEVLRKWLGSWLDLRRLFLLLLLLLLRLRLINPREEVAVQPRRIRVH